MAETRRKRRKYYKVGEIVWVKERKCPAKVLNLDIPNYDATLEVRKPNGEKEQIVLKFWEITKYRRKNRRSNRSRQTARRRAPLTVKVKYLTTIDDAFKPLEKIVVGDWIDLRAAETVELKAGEHKLIPLGIAMQLPRGYEAHIAPRSSTFAKWGILQTNTPGIVDNSYSGDNDQWFMSVVALRDTVINRGDRICQFRIVRSQPRVRFVNVETLGNPDRGGHGSTGEN